MFCNLHNVPRYCSDIACLMAMEGCVIPCKIVSQCYGFNIQLRKTCAKRQTDAQSNILTFHTMTFHTNEIICMYCFNLD